MTEKHKKYLINLLNKILSRNIEKEEVSVSLTSMLDPDYVYDSNDNLLTDIYISIKHYISGEEDLRKSEIEYFLECLTDKKKYSFEDKLKNTK